MKIKVVAMLEVYNDDDIVEEVIQHILSEELNLVILDNGSTDKTLEICQRFLGKGVDKIFSIASNSWELSRDLRIQYDLALTLSPDWVIRFDSDEFLETGIKGLTLHDGIAEVDKQGYNLIQFDLFHFFMTDNDEQEESVKKRLRYYSWATEFQFRAWKVIPGIRSDQSPHLPIFPEFLKYRIYPKKFVLRHYPFRNKQQAEKKLLDRLTKIKNINAEVELGMHNRYKSYNENNFPPVVDHQILTRYNDDNNWNLELKHLPFPTFTNYKHKKENIFSKDGKLLKERPSILDYILKLKKLSEQNLRLRTNNQNLKNKLIFQKMNQEEIFEYIYEQNLWESQESKSGRGSDLSQTISIRRELSHLFTELKINSILDIPCGDFNWFKEVELTNIKYIGADVVGKIVDNNQKQYSDQNITFKKLDITKDDLPQVDLILCRDLFIHLPFKQIFNALQMIKNSGSKFLITNSYEKIEKNKDTFLGGGRFLNLLLPPFCFSTPLYSIDEMPIKSDKQKKLYLWKINDLK